LKTPSMHDDLRKEYESHPIAQLVEIADSRDGEYRPEAIEAARAELSRRGETWEKGPDRHRDEDQLLEKSAKKSFLKGLYIVCWVMVCRSLIEIATAFFAARTENQTTLESSDFRVSIIMLLAFLICAWGLHVRLFRRPLLGRGRDPLSRLLIWQAKSRPPEMPDPDRR